MTADNFAGYELLQTVHTDGDVWVHLGRRKAASQPLPARIKRVAPGLQANPEACDTFAKESELSARFDHVGLVRTIEFGRAGGVPWVAQEVVDGITLSRMLATLKQTGHTMPAGVLVELAMRVSEALAHVHAAVGPDGRQLMLTHGGVNADHVWLTRDGGVKLDGFRLPGEALPGRGLGDPGYLAPELASGLRPDPRADLFALGVLLAEMVSGDRIRDARQASVAGHGFGHRLTELCARRSDLPALLPELLMELCSEDRDRRPQLARMLTHRLGLLLDKIPNHPGLPSYVAPGVNHVAPATADNLPARLLAEVRASGAPYPPSDRPEMTITTLAPSGHDELSAAPTLSAPPPKLQLPKLELPKPPNAPTAGLMDVPNGSGSQRELPKKLFTFDKPVPGKDVASTTWRPGAASGLPTWLLVMMGILSVIGAIALARMFVSDEADDPRDPSKKLARLSAKTGGSLVVTSDPPGALVYIDKQPTTFETPATLEGMKLAQDIVVTVAKNRFRDPSPRTLKINPQRKGAEVHFRLTSLHYYQVDTEPSGAQVSVNGRKTTETTPFELSPIARGETVDLEIKKRGFLPHSLTLFAESKTPTVTVVKLAPARLFDITSTPPGAIVKIDGERVGRTPLDDHPIALNRNFELEVYRPDARKWTRKLSAKGALEQKVKAKLRVLPLGKLALTSDERTELARIGGRLKESRRALALSKSELRKAQRQMRSFEHKSAISLKDLEEAQDWVDAAQADVAVKAADFENANAQHAELRKLVVARLELDMGY